MWVKRHMKQVIQSRRTGKLVLKDVPEPKVKADHVLVKTRTSLISAGTERMVVEFAKKSLVGKAKARPDLLKKVLTKAKRDGLKSTFQTVMTRLDEPLPLGYSAAGEVIAVGKGLEGVFTVGERVAIAGAGMANHAELNVVPRSLVAKIPEGVRDEEAAFGTLGAIALHAVRNLEPRLGDVVAVLGMGLVGQLAAQFLKLSGARVIAIDYNPSRLKLAHDLGVEACIDLGKSDAEQAASLITRRRGCDSILIAAATSSNEPFITAAAMARDRARVVMVGLTGTEFPYAEFMKKELNIIISRSYGPGRYDIDFEGRSIKYPEGWVRWTETENLAESLRLMSPTLSPRLNIEPLISHRMDFGLVESAYKMITSGSEPHMGVILNYPEIIYGHNIKPHFAMVKSFESKCVLGVIGAGDFSKSVLLPELKRLPNVILHTLATQHGATADHSKNAFGFLNATADTDKIFQDPNINAILIATRHGSHATLTTQALKAGKSVLVEKPLALDLESLNKIIDARNATKQAFFQVGFNRRFAPMAIKLKQSFADLVAPKVMNFRINAGAIPEDHWVQSSDEGGGRVLGEMCHFIDFARFLSGSSIASVHAHATGGNTSLCDDVSVSLNFYDGSLATILYTAQGDISASKERYEVFSSGRNGLIEDFKCLEISGAGQRISEKSAANKGFHASLSEFSNAIVNDGPLGIDEVELIDSSTATIAALESLRQGKSISI
jgi:predicted dehydrogenase/threonine dehydrogenase-like Zn-dependent dehydrogenase